MLSPFSLPHFIISLGNPHKVAICSVWVSRPPLPSDKKSFVFIKIGGNMFFKRLLNVFLWDAFVF